MNLEKIWKYRSQLYVALIISICVIAIFSYIRHLNEYASDDFIEQFRSLNASFWPPDIIPHPHLPEPNYPSPNDPVSIFDIV